MIKAVSVLELTTMIKQKIENTPEFQTICVEGEISNFKVNGASGHMYYTLKDESATIRCIMFSGYASKLDFRPEDGMKVKVLGRVVVYGRGGYYQIQAMAMKQEGKGNLYEELERLKAKLSKEGLFDQSHKLKIPFMPKTIGVLTSRTGAVIRDIINVATRRNPNVCIKLLPVPVQGTDAAPKIAEAVRFMNEKKLVDILIVGRGGGSIEDLWPFNEEVVVRAIYDSKIPVISAVGHETDWTLTDLVSDLRVPTPSAAAEVAVADVADLKEKLTGYKRIMKSSMEKRLEYLRMRLKNSLNSLKDPSQIIAEIRIRMDRAVETIYNKVKHDLTKYRLQLDRNSEILEAYNVLKTLDRGFCLLEKDGKYLMSVDDVDKGDVLDIRFKDGKKQAEIIE